MRLQRLPTAQPSGTNNNQWMQQASYQGQMVGGHGPSHGSHQMMSNHHVDMGSGGGPMMNQPNMYPQHFSHHQQMYQHHVMAAYHMNNQQQQVGLANHDIITVIFLIFMN